MAKKKAPQGRFEKLMASQLIESIRKKHGKSILAPADEFKIKRVARIPTGIFFLDYALGGGGFPAGRTNIVWGHKSTGKTVICLRAMGNAQKMCANCYTFPDSETGKCTCKRFRETICCFLDIEGCVAADQEILDPCSGFVGSVEDFMFQDDRHVVSWSAGSVAPANSPVRVDAGIKNTVLVRTRTTSLRVTPNHPVLVWRGGGPRWVEAADISPGESLGRPWRSAFKGKVTGINSKNAELLGLMLGDGSLNENGSVVFTNRDDLFWARLQELLDPWEVLATRYDDRHGRLIGRGLKKGAHRYGEGNKFRRWLSQLGLLGVRAGEKRLPGEVLCAPLSVVSAALTGLWMTDGAVNSVRPSAFFTSTSRTLAIQVRWLLSRIGVLGRVHTYYDGCDRHRPWHTVTVNGRRNLERFRAHVRLYGRRGELLDVWCCHRAKADKLPTEYLLPSYRSKEHRRERDRWENDTDVWWDKVVSVEDAGEVQCYDAGVPKSHSWAASDVVIHNSWDHDWAKLHGVNPDRVLLSVPEYAEQSLDIAESLLRSGDVDFLVIDSLAFLSPANEIKESSAKALQAEQARVLGRGIRKFGAALNHMGNVTGRRPTLLFTNQIRMKVGVLFGCFHGDTPVMFANGSQHRIHDVVKNEMSGPVLSWDGENIVERKVVGWFDNGVLPEGERFLTFRVRGSGGRRGAHGFTCTRSHVLVNGEGCEVRADQVRVGDTLLSWQEECLSPTDLEVVIGSMFGDGHITSKGNFCLSNSEQPEYLEWKKNFIQSYGFSLTSSSGRETWRTSTSSEFKTIRQEFYGSGSTISGKDYRTIPLARLERAGILALAVWYADDGSYKKTHRSGYISVKRLKPEYAAAVANVLSDRYAGIHYVESQRAIVLPTETFDLFSESVARFTPKCMAYKLLPEHRDRAATRLVPELPVLRRVPVPVEVCGVWHSNKKNRWKSRYDLRIEDDSYYLVGGDSRGIVVHNSPETQPGGFAPGFSATTETKTFGGKYEMDEVTGQPLHVDLGFKIEKNKSAGAKIEGEWRLVLSDTEIKKKGEVYEEPAMVEMGIKLGIVEKEGGFWVYGGEQYRSKSLLVKLLAEDPQAMLTFRETLKAILDAT